MRSTETLRGGGRGEKENLYQTNSSSGLQVLTSSAAQTATKLPNPPPAFLYFSQQTETEEEERKDSEQSHFSIGKSSAFLHD